ncbi:MAG: RsmB/NOP family class I SAM-dependent RNA methyltransferase [Pseudomonadota bacterium]
MTPEARHAAAAAILDEARAGRPVEQVLTNWARGNRYAGSGDRAAIRDIVFDAIRCRRSAASRGGGETGRALILGLLRDRGTDPDLVFTGGRFALNRLSEAERWAGAAPSGNAALDIPDWLAPELKRSLGASFEAVCEAFRVRADVFLRWNEARTTAREAMDLLAQDGIETEPHPLAPTALRVLHGARRIRMSAPYADGLVELQDAASQAVCASLKVAPSTRVLDYCAGGGGKSLALAARGATVDAHDADWGRMADIVPRARRAGCTIARLRTGELAKQGPYPLVVVDAPCSGSGAWRRQAEAKWTLTPTRLAEVMAVQSDVLRAGSAHVAPGGRLAYMTCSLLTCENDAPIEQFLEDTLGRWTQIERRVLSPLSGGDGFFLALLEHTDQP